MLGYPPALTDDPSQLSFSIEGATPISRRAAAQGEILRGLERRETDDRTSVVVVG